MIGTPRGAAGHDDRHARDGRPVQRLRRPGQPAGRLGRRCAPAAEPACFTLLTIFLSVLIGGVTFTGSLVACGKLSEKLTGRADPVSRPASWSTPACCWRTFALRRAVLHESDRRTAFLALSMVVLLALTLGRDDSDPDRRRRHAGGDLAAQQLLRSGGLRGRLRHQQQHADRRRLAGRRQRHHPDQHHVQGDEPLARQRALQRVRCRWSVPAGKIEGEVKPLTAEDAYYVLEAAQSVGGDRARLRHGRGPGPARRQGTAASCSRRTVRGDVRDPPGGRPHAGAHERAAGRGECALRAAGGDGRRQSAHGELSTWRS